MLTAEEKVILDEVSFKETALLLDKFKNLVRQSGSQEEKVAAYYIAEKLSAYEIPFEILWPELYLSTPQKAEVKIIGLNIDIPAKTPSFSMSTNERWVDGELIYAESDRQPYAWGELEYKLIFKGNPKGKIVICDGVPSPDKVNDIVTHGGVAAIFVQEGERIHEGICTTVWGTPELDDLHDLVKIPVVSINHDDGLKLVQKVQEGKVRGAVRTSLKEGWKTCPLVLAKIPGSRESEKFVLVHGHLDSWHAGIGDNALGNATLLEVSKVLNLHRNELKRSVWVAWWPGHSTGRFAGSTWFADQYGLEIAEHCIAQVNCEAPGCTHANTYEEMMWTEDVDDFCRELVTDVTGMTPGWRRPVRAGDYSFHNIGVSSFFMLSSTMGRRKMEELGYYPVYGCGGNIEWHTEDDDLHLVDERIFLRDTKLYLAGVLKMVNSEIIPIDCRKMLTSMENYLKEYWEATEGGFELTCVFDEIKELRQALDKFHLEALKARGDDTRLIRINETILKLTRKLIRLNYTSKPEFKHDPAAMIPPIPDLAPMVKMPQLSPNEQKFLRTQLVRGRNRVCYTLKECRELLLGEF